MRRSANAGRADTSPPLGLISLRKEFGGVTAVNDVTFDVARGERVGLIGPNGAGKTSLFRLIAGDGKPTRGQVFLEGDDVTDRPAHVRARRGLGRTFQITNLFPTLTVAENLLLAARDRGAEAKQRVNVVADDFKLHGIMATPVGTLAYGEQRRLELALALCADVNLLLLDEPAAGLGPADREQMKELIAALPPELTLLLIEHDMELALEVTERVICMHQGSVVADDSSARIHEHPMVREIYLGVDPLPEGSEKG